MAKKALLSSLTFRYLFVLGLLAFFSLAGYLILEGNIRAQKSNAAIVNVSGRQRMLSQRIALFSLRLVNATEKPQERQRLRNELKAMLLLMESSHNGLLNTDIALGLLAKPSREIKALYFSFPIFLDRQVRSYLEEARGLILAQDSELSLANPHLQFLLETSGGRLLESLDRAVKLYQKESESEISYLESLQFFVLAAILFILSASGLFIFRPMVSRIQRETLQLREQSLALGRSNEQLQKEINERQELENKLQEAYEFDKKTQERLALAERFASIGRMAGIIAHEFRNQLGVIRNVSYFLKMKINGKDEKVRRHLGILDEQVMETERIITNILNFSRDKQPELQAIDLSSLLVTSIDKVALPEGIKLTLNLGEMPPVQADPIQLGGVFVNLLLNAVQAMEQKGKLLISLEKINNYVTIIFKDSGCGIKEEDKKRLFEPFFSTKARGTGLGLATAKAIIDRHGGDISIESEYGQGAAIIIKLPIKVEV